MKISQDILQILEQSETFGNELRLTQQMDRSMYVKVNKVLEAAGGKWMKKSKTHVFPTDATERIEQIILSGEVEIPKDEFDYFPTPKSVVQTLIDESEIEFGMLGLEPSAGQAAIAEEMRKIVGNENLFCYELSETNFNHLIQNGYNAEMKDFLSVIPEKKFDRIIMNPPFGKQNDIKHVLHAFNFLKSNGILVSVMCSNILWRDNKLTNEFRKFVAENNGTITKLPDQSFKSSGTNVGTVIVKIRNGE